MRIDPASLSPGRRYFLLISCVVPRPIAWTGTVNEDGSYNLAPFSYFNNFSATPPIIGIGFGPHDDKPLKDTLRNIQRTGELTVNIASVALAGKLNRTSEELPYGTDEFAHAAVTPLRGEQVAAPRVAEAPISMECTLWQVIDLGGQGSHLLLAEVKLLHILDTLLDNRGTVDVHRLKPLARLGGGKYAELGEVFSFTEHPGSLG
jgi:flavin reductase (DIM6/NTAB) family NADH-FMN oxidoreductase RutF